jgi:hypothetical protein
MWGYGWVSENAEGRKWVGSSSYSRGFYRKLCVYVGVVALQHVTNQAMLGLTISIVPYSLSLFLSTLHTYSLPHTDHYSPHCSQRIFQIFIFRRKRHLEASFYFIFGFNNSMSYNSQYRFQGTTRNSLNPQQPLHLSKVGFCVHCVYLY